jgi:hypothetical protein
VRILQLHFSAYDLFYPMLSFSAAICRRIMVARPSRGDHLLPLFPTIINLPKMAQPRGVTAKASARRLRHVELIGIN